MDQFTFTSKEKLFSGGLMLLGLICAIMIFIGDPYDHHARFWTNFLHNSVFFTGIAFVTLYLIAASTLAYAGWHIVVKRVMEAMSLFLPVGIVLFLIIWLGTITHQHHLYHWAAEGITDKASEHYDKLIDGKSGLLNTTTYLIGTVGLISVWSIFALVTRRISVNEDKGTTGLNSYKKLKVWLAIFLPIGAFSSFLFILESTMSVDPHWYSTMFAWYNTASYLVSACCILALIVIYLNKRGYLLQVNQKHRHDMGLFIFAFSIFWTYLWFDQFMLIWYANVGEETIYFKQRMNDFPILFWGNIAMNFLLPFFVLMRNSTKWKVGSLGFVATAVLFGHWWDFFMMVKPGIYGELTRLPGVHGAEMGWHIPGLADVGMALGFVGLFLFIVFTALSRAALVPKHDPFLGESLTHHA